MRKFARFALALALIALSISVLCGCNNANNMSDSTATNISMDELNGCMKGITLKVATTGTLAPFTYYADNGTDVIGFDMDVIDELQKLLGFEIENGSIDTMNVATITASLTEGKLDMVLAALCATDERKEVMNFSNNYYDAGQIILINSETSPSEIQGIEDLVNGNYSVAVETGSASHLYAKKVGISEDNIKPYNEGPIAFAALEESKIDCFIQDVPSILYYLKTNPDSKLQMVGEQFNRGQAPYAIAISFDVCERYPNFVEVINAALQELTDNGTMSALEQKWCG